MVFVYAFLDFLGIIWTAVFMNLSAYNTDDLYVGL